MALTVGSLFSGIGGIDLGLERVGMVTRWFVEWDAHCQNVLRRHWPGLPVYGDITAVDWSGVEPVDVLAGGFPCQPISIAGARRAQTDERWLWTAFADAIRVLRPRYVLLENVPNLLAVNDGSAASEVYGDLAALGFDIAGDCIPARAVGAPHLRDRVWIVAYWPEQRWTLADTDNRRPRNAVCARRDAARNGSSNVANPERIGYPPSEALDLWGGIESVRGWSPEPDVGRVADGVPHRVDRLRALGNAVVPQVVEWIGRRIVAFDEARKVSVA